ncbi:MAG: DUF1572 domain-containing protein [Bacteroidetes bacterium]|nr:MAG: DUF1572 domain-containing protein [Bacteroidota bacterium]REK04872.1 MAG: DUF1572 domain-containing protein [Bacteroidota bacterium]REK36344.1 MAG: DUF1572 domain-containing protein [Bacteroidota bacterium]REK50990.1 MAG: DUF1572 domain-containing protein [Bacteroidota bacterium]
MLSPILLDLFIRDLQKLEEEIKLYEKDDDLWILGGSINNTAGNLCLHICGNLQHFIGAILGHSGYERNREDEFSQKYIPRYQLIHEIEKTKAILDTTLKNLSEEDLFSIYPVHVFGKELNTSYFLIHLLSHLNYHLGQVNYHRRLLAKTI